MWSFLLKIGGGLVSLFSGGSLEKVLDVIERKMDNETKKEEIKAEVTKKWVEAQSQLLVGRTWWFQLFFVIPLGFWWTAVIMDSVFHFEADVAALPSPLDSWAGAIISALFIVDGGKALVGRLRG